MRILVAILAAWIMLTVGIGCVLSAFIFNVPPLLGIIGAGIAFAAIALVSFYLTDTPTKRDLRRP